MGVLSLYYQTTTSTGGTKSGLNKLMSLNKFNLINPDFGPHPPLRLSIGSYLIPSRIAVVVLCKEKESLSRDHKPTPSRCIGHYIILFIWLWFETETRNLAHFSSYAVLQFHKVLCLYYQSTPSKSVVKLKNHYFADAATWRSLAAGT